MIYGKCKICSRQGKLVRDHNHSTGYIRGLVCDLCNSYLGFLDSGTIFKRKKTLEWYLEYKKIIQKYRSQDIGILYTKINGSMPKLKKYYNDLDDKIIYQYNKVSQTELHTKGVMKYKQYLI